MANDFINTGQIYPSDQKVKTGGKMTQQDLADVYEQFHGRPLKQADIAALGDSWKNMNREEFIQNVVVPSTEYQSNLRRGITQPLSETEMTGFTTQAQKQFEPLQKAFSEGIAGERQLLDVNFEDLKKRLTQQAEESSKGVTGKFANLGLLQSGATAAGLGRIAEQTTSNIAKADIERAINQADLALQEAGYSADVQSKIAQEAGTLAGREYTRRAEASGLARSEMGQLKSLSDASLTRQTTEQTLELQKKQVEDALKTSGLNQELSKRGFDITKFTTTAKAWNEAIAAGEPLDEALYNELKRILTLSV